MGTVVLYDMRRVAMTKAAVKNLLRVMEEAELSGGGGDSSTELDQYAEFVLQHDEIMVGEGGRGGGNNGENTQATSHVAKVTKSNNERYSGGGRREPDVAPAVQANHIADTVVGPFSSSALLVPASATPKKTHGARNPTNDISAVLPASVSSAVPPLSHSQTPRGESCGEASKDEGEQSSERQTGRVASDSRIGDGGIDGLETSAGVERKEGSCSSNVCACASSGQEVLSRGSGSSVIVDKHNAAVIGRVRISEEAAKLDQDTAHLVVAADKSTTVLPTPVYSNVDAFSSSERTNGAEGGNIQASSSPTDEQRKAGLNKLFLCSKDRMASIFAVDNECPNTDEQRVSPTEVILSASKSGDEDAPETDRSERLQQKCGFGQVELLLLPTEAEVAASAQDASSSQSGADREGTTTSKTPGTSHLLERKVWSAVQSKHWAVRQVGLLLTARALVSVAPSMYSRIAKVLCP